MSIQRLRVRVPSYPLNGSIGKFGGLNPSATAKKINNNRNYETKTGLSQNIYQVMGADNRKFKNASMAQLVEHLTFNQRGDVSPLWVRVPLGALVYDLVAQLVDAPDF